MANKVYNLAGGLHSAAAYAGWENELFGGNAVASATALKVGAGSGMTVSVGKGNALIDTGDDYSRRVALTEAVDVTLDQADTSLPRNDLIVIYVDMAVTPVQTVQDNTNGILKVVAVKGTPASSPSDPDAGTIQQSIGAGNPYMILASIRVNAGASAISSGNITDKRPASPNVYSATPTETDYPLTGTAGPKVHQDSYQLQFYRIGHIVIAWGAVRTNQALKTDDIIVNIPKALTRLGYINRAYTLVPVGSSGTGFVRLTMSGDSIQFQTYYSNTNAAASTTCPADVWIPYCIVAMAN